MRPLHRVLLARDFSSTLASGPSLTKSFELGLPSAANFQVRRFDRVRAQNSVERLHVIHGCQMLDLTSSYKYERPFRTERDVQEIRDGASLPKLFAARHFSVGPVQFALRLLRWTLFPESRSPIRIPSAHVCGLR